MWPGLYLPALAQTKHYKITFYGGSGTKRSWAGIQRQRDAECFLAGCAFGALQGLGDFFRWRFLSGECLQLANLYRCPRASLLSIFHKRISLYKRPFF